MSGLKRSYISPKGNLTRHTDKRDLPSSSEGNLDQSSADNDETKFHIPAIKLSDNSRILPRYSAILSRSDNGVNMDDLDLLQQDLEKLMSTCAIRNRYLRAELEGMDKSLKRKRPDDRFKYKESKNGNKPLKRHYTLPVNNLIGDTAVRHELPKINLTKNDTSDKFWASVEPYCAAITNYHSAFLDKLIEECSQEVDVKIPELGEYYANEWNESAINTEHDLGLSTKPSNGNSGTGGVGIDLKKNGLNSMVETFSNPMTQRLLALLIEERVMTSFPTVSEKLKPSDLNIIKSSGTQRPALCMDRILKENLIEQGILSADDLPKEGEEDEVLLEIKKCQQELASVNAFNVEQLKRLKTIVTKDLQKQDIKAALSKVDSQILELYNKVLLTKQKQIEQAKDETKFDKATFTTILREFETQTDTLIKEQISLQKQLAELNKI